MMAAPVRILLCLTGFLALSQPAWCEQPTPGRLLRRTPWVCFEVAGGRITLPSLASAPNRTFSHDGGDVKESLVLNAGEGPSLSYRYQSPQREFTVEYRDGGVLTLHDDFDGQVTHLEQSQSGLKLRASDLELQSASLWHLLLFSPEAGQRLIAPLSALNQAWHLEQQTTDIKRLLCAPTAVPWQQERDRWQRCANELASSDFLTRQSAERTLRAGGSGAAALLKTIQDMDLEAEQRRRIERIVEDARLRRDEPSSVAAAMMYDARVWWSLMHDEQEDVRRHAANHLTLLLGRPLSFNLAADAQTRHNQLQRIEEALLK